MVAFEDITNPQIYVGHIIKNNLEYGNYYHTLFLCNLFLDNTILFCKGTDIQFVEA